MHWGGGGFSSGPLNKLNIYQLAQAVLHLCPLLYDLILSSAGRRATESP